MTHSAPASNPGTSAKPKVKNIPNPRRLLILTPTTQSPTIIPPLLHSLTGVPVVDPPQQPALSPTSSSTPPPPTSTFAGYTTHSPLRLETKYYTTEVPVWVDEIPLVIHDPDTQSTPTPAPTAEQWKTEFLSTEAEIVREAVGALVVCAHTPSDVTPPPGSNANADPAERPDVRALRDLMRGVGAVKERIDEERGGLGDVPGVFVLIGSRKGAAGAAAGQQGPKDPDEGLGLGVDDEDLGGGERRCRFRSGGGRISFSIWGCWGGRLLSGILRRFWRLRRGISMGVKRVGMPRIKEVLETHDWSTVGGDSGFDGDNDPDVDSDDDLQDQLLGMGGSRGFGDEVHELEREMFGLRMAIERGGGDGDERDDSDHDDGEDEIDVESMEALMMRMQAIKDMSSELPEGERKRFAAKAVQDIMREL
ncbi:hypothetical protein N7465_006978 [Penicillium sp. CMV-2018d]|nr:hypothetical protein N7465_006978 [Penicillium sp. CMV-2018d]